ncbi:MAG: translational GTPase TypA [Actinobacteria bacterium]|nr:translational GTPase TypA [Actinomycetota bacterium]NCU80816.1 translational GTPase TypA [Acidimicrobiia bacterium]NDC99174.1 translational GTPase TypA [bacterium]HBQ52731.1 translational GTPase TypA [Acidimicrobium sp.]NBO97244.1 translational GTPase TypA [Actinomycetota bacterium]
MNNIRNLALVAHVDHGKTTLLDALLKSGGTFAAHQAVVDRVMDSNDQERERGITILAKAAEIEWRGTKINLVDTPGHADFGGEVERALALVDGILLLVDAAEGPLPQTRYVLSKALARDLPVVVVLNKVDRADARPEEVLHEVEQLFLDLAHHDHHLSFPVISAVARDGRSMKGIGMPAENADLVPLLDAVLDTIPPPTADAGAPLQALVANLDASDYLGRLAIGRVESGVMKKGDMICVWQHPTPENPAPFIKRKISTLFAFRGIGREEVGQVSAGDLFILAGIDEVEVGDTIAALENAPALPRLEVDEPVLRMSFGVNTSPFAGREGTFLTSRHLSERLFKEVLGNVSIRVNTTDSPDVIDVAGRGELQLAVLIENMRREGYELQVSRPEVITKEIDGKKHEPLEAGTIDVPDEYVGAVTQALAPRKGRVVNLEQGDSGRTIVSFQAPSRGLIGFRSLLLTVTRGTALLHQSLSGYMPWAGELPHRIGGAMVSDRKGSTTAYALDNLQLRGTLFVAPGVEVYEGMVVGENSREDEMVVNAVRAKELTNIRTHSHDDGPKLATPITHTLESGIQWIGEDELVEVTPSNIRIRKRYLSMEDRRKSNKTSKN